MSSIIVSTIDSTDLAEVVALHIEAFPGFFLSRLGPGVLRLFYAEFVDHPDAVALTARLDRVLVGIAVGPTIPSQFFRRLVRRRWLQLAVASAPHMLRNPHEIPRMARSIVFRGREGVTGGGLLSSICVAPRARASGVGRLLLSHWEERMASRGIEQLHLTTDAVDNEATIRFYRKAGWEVVRSFTTRDGRRMHLMSKELTGVA